MDTNAQFPADFESRDFETQLAVFKAFYNSDDLIIKYIDDEEEEVGVFNQTDLDYAYKVFA